MRQSITFVSIRISTFLSPVAYTLRKYHDGVITNKSIIHSDNRVQVSHERVEFGKVTQNSTPSPKHS